jgi:hypothetical protein
MPPDRQPGAEWLDGTDRHGTLSSPADDNRRIHGGDRPSIAVGDLQSHPFLNPRF